MTTDDQKKILETSKHIKEIASKLLEEKNIMEILSQVGKPEIIGSYALDLMFDEDIDIVVETDNPKKSAKEALNYFIDNETTQKYEFGDFVKFPRENRPQGYIVNIKTIYENTKWEVEIWFLKDTSEYKKQLKTYQDKIDKKTEKKYQTQNMREDYQAKTNMR